MRMGMTILARSEMNDIRDRRSIYRGGVSLPHLWECPASELTSRGHQLPHNILEFKSAEYTRCEQFVRMWSPDKDVDILHTNTHTQTFAETTLLLIYTCTHTFADSTLLHNHTYTDTHKELFSFCLKSLPFSKQSNAGFMFVVSSFSTHTSQGGDLHFQSVSHPAM